jgi:hypothetical protein
MGKNSIFIRKTKFLLLDKTISTCNIRKIELFLYSVINFLKEKVVDILDFKICCTKELVGVLHANGIFFPNFFEV